MIVKWRTAEAASFQNASKDDWKKEPTYSKLNSTIHLYAAMNTSRTYSQFPALVSEIQVYLR